MYDGNKVRHAIEVYFKVKSYRKASSITGISKSTIHRWVVALGNRFKRPSKQSKKRKFKPRKYKELDQDVKDIVAQTAKLTISQIKRDIAYAPSLSTIQRSLKRNNIRCKKATCKLIPCTERLRQQKREFKEFVEQQDIKIEEVVCLDEVGFTNMPNNLKCYALVNKRKTFTVPKRVKCSGIACISNAGLVTFNQQPKAYNSTSFLEFLKGLVPLLAPHHKYILMDNVKFHYNKDCLQFLALHGLTPLFIPPYSPEYNPIEEVFSVLKKCFRQHLASGTPLNEAVQTSFTNLKAYKEVVNMYTHSRRYWTQAMDGDPETKSNESVQR